MKEWSAAAAEGRRLAEGAAVNATLLLSVPAASEETRSTRPSCRRTAT